MTSNDVDASNSLADISNNSIVSGPISARTDRKSIASIDFLSAGEIIVVRREDGSIFQYAPQDRYAKKERVPLNPDGNGDFCRLTVHGLPATGGVYAVTSDGLVRYVGKSTGLKRRWSQQGYGSIQPRNCYAGGQSTNCHINKRILEDCRAGRKLEVWFVSAADPTELAEIENRLIEQLRPAWNRTHRNE